jgi:hypothetical protein
MVEAPKGGQTLLDDGVGPAAIEVDDAGKLPGIVTECRVYPRWIAFEEW